jgi:PPOX class probable F420-dependent enzyme
MVASLAGERYISLTSFKRDGTPVSTPVWVVSDDGRRLLVWTGAGTWKVKRIRRDPHVLVAASSMRGTERGERIAATARLADVPGLDELFRRKYGWQKRLVDFLNRKSPPGAWTAIEIADPDVQVTSSSLGFSR